jgi:predicted AAA+ superfamily ATPase
MWKTTLNKEYCRDIKDVHFFDLENPQDLSALESPAITLPKLSGLIVIDEIQRRPDLFVSLRFLVDNSDLKLLILGSASQALRPSKSG